MTIGGRLASLFPFVYFSLNMSCLFYLLKEPSLFSFFLLLCFLYLLPLSIFRLHHLFFKLQEGDFDLSKKKYSPWWTSHMLQYPFIALPFLESLLHFVPGLYSLWLKAWGAKIGKGVMWTPRVEIIDRSLIEVGDRCIIGHMVICVSHLIDTSKGYPQLVIKKIKIGTKSLVGADSQLGPGSIIEPGTRIKTKTRMYWKGEYK